MPALPIGDYRPDLSDTRASHTSALNNVLPRADGYGPVRDVSTLTTSLPAACRGYFVAYRTDGSDSVSIFAGTATELYLLDNGSFGWTLVSKSGGPYTDINADAHWSFAQFGDVIVATHQNVPMQYYDLSSSTAFSDLGGTPPRAGGVTVINRFLVAYDLLDNPQRVQWSGLNAITTWTAGTSLSSYQDFPDGGRVMCVAGGEFGIVLQAQGLRRMVLAIGSEYVFQIERIATDRGMLGQYSIVQAGDRILFLTGGGFMQLDATGVLTPIGSEKIDRTFLGDYDTAASHMIIGAADPAANLALWAYKSLSGSSGQFDTLLAYNWALDRWATITLSGEYMAQAAQPGVTLEYLDTIATGVLTIENVTNNGSGLVRITVASTATLTTGDVKTISGVLGATGANGTHTITVVNATTFDLSGSTFGGAYASGGVVAGSLDAMALSLDFYGGANQPKISICNTVHKIGFLSGDTLEATLETSEQRIINGRLLVDGAWPLTDAPSVYVAAGTRDALDEPFTYSDESPNTSDHFCPLLSDGRGVRFKVRIPAATAWTYCSGVEPELQQGGMW